MIKIWAFKEKIESIYSINCIIVHHIIGLLLPRACKTFQIKLASLILGKHLDKGSWRVL